jgi:hypothetical protein
MGEPSRFSAAHRVPNVTKQLLLPHVSVAGPRQHSLGFLLCERTGLTIVVTR